MKTLSTIKEIRNNKKSNFNDNNLVFKRIYQKSFFKFSNLCYHSNRNQKETLCKKQKTLKKLFFLRLFF